MHKMRISGLELFQQWMIDLSDVAGVTPGFISEYGNDSNRLAIETRMHMLVSAITGSRCSAEERNVGWIALTFGAMRSGAAIPKHVKEFAQHALSDYPCSNGDIETRLYIGHMYDMLEDYDGTPTDPAFDLVKYVGADELNEGVMPHQSDAVLRYASRMVANHLSGKTWFEGVQYAINGDGYRMLVLVSRTAAEKDPGAILDDTDVPAKVFGIPVSFYVQDQETII